MLSFLKYLAPFSLFATASFSEVEPEAIDFNRDIRPILSDNCYYCHGPDEETRDGDLRLDIRADAVDAYAIVPGDAEDSELIIRIFTDDKGDLMPRPSTHKTLNAEEKQTLVQWINEGANYDEHWSYTPVEKPQSPSIDSIVSERLEQQNLKLSPNADKRTLIRRVSLDVIGLPPTPDEVNAFLKDNSPDAYKKLVDRLLASDRYGEKMAIAWLDAVRYADTVGYHGDQERDATPFRDYVINAFNENKPFDAFTIEQIAGDLLPNPTIKQKVAASYSRLNQLSREGGIQDKEYIKKYQAERVRTTATTWLGSTLACAECHDHKFDPFTARDFYSMAAFFSDILEKGAYTNVGAYQEKIEPYLNDPLENEGWFGPELTVLNEVFHSDPESVRETIRIKEEQLAQGSPEAEKEFALWLAQQKELSDRQLPSTQSFEVSKNEESKARTLDLTSYPWRLSELAEISHEIRTISAGGNISPTLQIDYSLNGEIRSQGYFWGDAPDSALKEIPAIRIGPSFYRGPWITARIPRSKLNIPDDAQLLTLTIVNKAASYRNFQLRSLYQGTERAPFSEQGKAVLAKTLDHTADNTETADLKKEYFLQHAESLSRTVAEIDLLREELEGKRYTPLTISAKPREVKILPRGNWMDESGEIVLPATPGFLPNPIASSKDRRLTRLDLAKWIVHPENPLASRAFVNRLWAQFFGSALSSAPEDLGLQGVFPTYPKLLDWLAYEFIDSDWDIKHMVRTIVLSDVYRQTSDVSPERYKRDPNNELLARQSPVRLPAEIIRDNTLQISGLLNTEMGGPSSRPYQPKGYYSNLNFPKRKYKTSMNASQYRRGIYMHWQRTFLHPMISAFDAQGRDECVIKRDLSNTPLQALNLLNDPTQTEAARAFAENILDKHRNDKARIKAAYIQALARPPSKQEINILRSFLQRERERFFSEDNLSEAFLEIGLKKVNSQHDPNELASFTSLCRAILNLHETINRY